MTITADRLGSSRRRRATVTTPTVSTVEAEAEGVSSAAHNGERSTSTSIRSTRSSSTKKVNSSLDEAGGNKLRSRMEKACSEGRGMQLLYLFTFYGGWTYGFLGVYPMIDESINVGSHHRIIGVFVFLSCATSWFLASNVSPGNITKETMAKYDNYHYDNLLYVNKECPTLQIRKLARSKFDRYSQTHVPRFDHFCPLLMQSVGEENYRLFLAFLILHTGMCFYGCDIVCRLLWGLVLQDPETSKLLLESKLSVLAALRRLVVMFMLNHPLGYLGALLFVCSLAMTKFLGFHLYLIARGMTTNEYYKWQDVSALYEYERSRWDEKSRSDVETPRSASGVKQQQLNLRDKHKNSFKNSYNLGVVNNVHEVMFPRCLQAQNNRKSKHRAKRK